MSAAWWLISGGGLLAYSLAAFAYFLRRPEHLDVHKNVLPYADAFAVTLAIVALARPDQPIWIGYALIITSLSTFHTTRYQLFFAITCIGMLWAAAAILDATGRADLPWRLTTIVSIMTVFTALNCDVIATSNRKLRMMVREAALTDPLTGLDNRRRFRQVLESHATPEAQPLAVLMYDLDNFKQLNEERGHVHADTVLVRVAHELRASFRDADTIARYGGDELIVLAHVGTVDDAVAMGERSLAQIHAQVGVTMSAGVSVYPITSRTLEAAVREADDALGRAKHGGKARVAVAAAA
jgi:diguanylate cyclase (GGDEF)-like protein